jgi:hypothetical protein
VTMRFDHGFVLAFIFLFLKKTAADLFRELVRCRLRRRSHTATCR